MRYWCKCAVIFTAFTMVGCARSPFEGSSWPTPRPLGQELTATRPDMEDAVLDQGDSPVAALSAPSNPDVESTGDLSMRDAMALALLRNPELKRFGLAVRMADAKAMQAGAWSNPEVSFEIENFAGSGSLNGFDGAEYTLALSQTIPLGDDIAHRRKLAALDGQRAGWDYEAARISLLAEVARRYADVLAAQHQIALVQNSLTFAEQIADSIRRRVEAGDAAPVEKSRAAVPVATAGIELNRAKRNLESARVRLALTWDSSTPRFDKVAGDLEQVLPIPTLEALTSTISDNPEVARWAVEIASRQANLERIRAEAIPDLTASLGYRWFNASDENALVAGVSLSLPIFDRKQGDKLAARMGITAAQQEQRAATLRIKNALASTYARLANAYEEAIALHDLAIPPAENAYRDIQQAFDQGNLGYLDVLDSERTLIELRQQYFHALADYHGSVAELEGLTGRPLDTLGTDAVKTNIDTLQGDSASSSLVSSRSNPKLPSHKESNP